MRVWVDDIRIMPNDYDVWAKTYDEAIQFLKTKKVTHISLDHDLGVVGEKTGYDIALWIEVNAYYGILDSFTYSIHSANPVGAKNIEDAMRNAERYWKKEK